MNVRPTPARVAGAVVSFALGFALGYCTLEPEQAEAQRSPARKVAPVPQIPDGPSTIEAKPTPTKAEPQDTDVDASSVWYALAECETGGDWAYNGPSGYDGGLQFHPGTWTAHKPEGAPAYAWQATIAQQIQAAESARADAGGFGPWPGCAAKLGLPT